MLLMLSKLGLSHHCSRTGPESRKLCRENRHGQKLDSDPTEGKHTLGFQNKDTEKLESWLVYDQ